MSFSTTFILTPPTTTATCYRGTIATLTQRIMDLVPSHPEILHLSSAWGLFRIPGFQCDDLAPSLAQAAAALTSAQQQFKLKTET